MATDRIRALGDRLWGSFTAAAGGTSPENQELEDDGLEMQVHEKEDVELDVLNLKEREIAASEDQGHIVELSAVPDKKDACKGRKGKVLTSAGVADGEEEQQQQGQISPAQTKLYASKWTLVSRLSSRLAGAQSAQAAQAGSASEQSTPSNLERAVLLLEAETESVSSDSKVSAATSAVSSPSQPAGGIEAEAGDSNSSAASARGPEQGASIAAGVKAQPAEHKEVLSDRASSADLEAHRTALRRLDVAGSQGGSAGGSDSLDEGPCTPPASSAAARADTKASSSPNSTAGDMLERLPPLPCGEPGRKEMHYYATCINHRLRNDSALSHALPLQPEPALLADACRDGILLCKLLNSCVPDTIDERALNLPAEAAEELASKEALQNSNLCIHAASALGCNVSAVSAQDILQGSQDTVKCCVWEFIKLGALKDVSVKAVPETVVLQRPEEDVSRLLNVPAEQLLLRWVAHHIGAAGAAWEAWLPLKDMGPDLADCTALGCLLAQLEPCTASVINFRETDLVTRAGMVLEAASMLTDEPLPPARSLAEGDADMIMMLLATLFRARHGLQGAAAEREGQMTQFAQWLEEYDVQDSREERTFRVWLLSLLRSEVHIQNLAESLRDGWVLLRVLDTIAPGCVRWQAAHRPPFKPLLQRPKSIENCNQVVGITRRVLALPLVNIGGIDILNGQHKLLLAILWQLMRYNIRGLLQSVSGRGRHITDAELDRQILTWANQRLEAAGKRRRISSFHDSSLSSGLPLVDLLSAVEPRCINLAMVTPGGSVPEREMNAKYVISIARKLGCSIFLLWEDVVEVNAKMILVFVASLMLHNHAEITTELPNGQPRICEGAWHTVNDCQG